MSLSRRNFLYGTGASLGAVAMSDLFARAAQAETTDVNKKEKKPHHEPKAKACIMLFMEGGPSQIDTFDPKKKLDELHLKPFVAKGEEVSSMTRGNRFYVKSPFKFREVGEAKIPMNEHFKFLGEPEVANELCVYRGCQAESVNHPTALFHMNTGSRFAGEPAIGSWLNYGLGSENENLPGYVVMTELAAPQGGSGNWSNGFLPATYQGTPLRSKGSPILDLNPPAWKSREHQRANLNVLAKLNQASLREHPEHDALAARIANYELAFRMQMEVPNVINLDDEPQHVKDMYGVNDPDCGEFARKCLLARKLVQNGVRFIQIFSGGWDSHDFIERAHQKRIKSIDKPVAALIKDLKTLGMLDETMVMWTGEFGRTSDNTVRGGETAIGRDHNAKAMSMFFAGGGTKPGLVGGTNEIGQEAVEVVHPIRDVHVTLLHLFGLDDNKLTYFHGGRFKQLSQFGGEIIPELIA